MRRIPYSLVYISGGSSGIGLAIAKKCVHAGMGVFIFARNRDRLDAAYQSLTREAEAASGSRGQAVPVYAEVLDVSDRAQVAECIPRCLQRSGVPDLLINCAGIARPGYFEELPLEVFEQTININLLGTIYMTRAVYPAMRERKRGRIINVSSMAGLIGVFGYTAYGASKFGIVGFSETLRAEAKPQGITVQVLCPPDTDTPQLAEENKYKPDETRAVAGNVQLRSADVVADGVMKRLYSRSFFIFPSFDTVLVYHVHRLFPGLVTRILDTQISTARGQKIHRNQQRG